MSRSTLWLAYEKDGKSLAPLVKALNEVLNKKVMVPDQDDEFEYAINRISEQTSDTGVKFYLFKLLKYKKTRVLETFNPQENLLSDESVKNYPLMDYSLFAIYSNWMLIEEKIPHMGHKRVLVTVQKFYSKISKTETDFSFEFKLSDRKVQEFLSQIDRILLVRFSNIGKNPGPKDENLKRFEELTGDTEASIIEISNSSEGIRKESKYVKGGFILVDEGKAQMKIEAQKGKELTTFNTRKGRSKEKEVVEYERGQREASILEKLKKLIKW